MGADLELLPHAGADCRASLGFRQIVLVALIFLPLGSPRFEEHFTRVEKPNLEGAPCPSLPEDEEAATPGFG